METVLLNALVGWLLAMGLGIAAVAYAWSRY